MVDAARPTSVGFLDPVNYVWNRIWHVPSNFSTGPSDFRHSHKDRHGVEDYVVFGLFRKKPSFCQLGDDAKPLIYIAPFSIWVDVPMEFWLLTDRQQMAEQTPVDPDEVHVASAGASNELPVRHWHSGRVHDRVLLGNQYNWLPRGRCSHTLQYSTRGMRSSWQFARSSSMVAAIIQAGLEPTVLSYAFAIHACAKSSDTRRAEENFERMRTMGVETDTAASNSVIHLWANHGCIRRQRGG